LRHQNDAPGLIGAKKKTSAAVLLLQHRPFKLNRFAGVRHNHAAVETPRAGRNGQSQFIAALIGNLVVPGKRNLVGNALREIASLQNQNAVREVQDRAAISAQKVCG